MLFFKLRHKKKPILRIDNSKFGITDAIMRYHYLLYSRSLKNDYRWMLSPDYLNTDELDLIINNYWSDSVRQSLTQSLRGIYYFHLNHSSILLQFGVTDQKLSNIT
jgi:hypothetical protein